MTSRRTDRKLDGYTVHPTTPPAGECGCGRPAVATVDGDVPACVECAAAYTALGTSVVYNAVPIPGRPECADGCPLTDTSECATGCVRATMRPEPLTVTVTAAVTSGHVGTDTPQLEPTVPALENQPDPFSWAPYLALLAVILTAIVCAAAGWTR